MNIVYVLVADTFAGVIPGPDPGIQVMVSRAARATLLSRHPVRDADTPASQRGTWAATAWPEGGEKKQARRWPLSIIYALLSML